MTYPGIRVALAGAAACCVLGTVSAAHAGVACSSLPGTIIYGAGGSAQQPYIAQVATQLAKLTPPISIVYSDSASACVGYSDLTTTGGVISGTAAYWDGTGSGTTLSCTLDITGDPVTFAVMGNAPNLCPGGASLPSGYGQFLGPAQAVDFVVPVQSSQQSISTEAAYYIWGFGAAAPNAVTPWTQSTDIFTRSASSFVNVFVALDTGVPAATVAAHGTSETTNSATVAALAALNGTSSAEQGIGFVSGEVADGNRSSVRVLSYQHTGQTCGYWPDSTATAFDKANIRDGQYWLWSPIHFFAAVDSSGAIVDTKTASFIGTVTGAAAAPTGFDLFAAEFGAYTVPKCAMQVWRDGDLAPLYSYSAPASCSCEFDIASSNANKPASCKTCKQDSDCSAAASHCRNVGPALTGDSGVNVGYCEVN